MSKEDSLKLSGTTKKRIGKKSMPSEAKKVDTGKLKKTNVQLTEKIHFQAKLTAMEIGTTLKDYINSLIVEDLKKRGKL